MPDTNRATLTDNECKDADTGEEASEDPNISEKSTFIMVYQRKNSTSLEKYSSSKHI